MSFCAGLHLASCFQWFCEYAALVFSSCHHLQVTIQTEDIDLAGELVQDAAAYLGLTELASTASFPVLMQSFQTVLIKVLICYTSQCCICSDADVSEQVTVLQ